MAVKTITDAILKYEQKYSLKIDDQVKQKFTASSHDSAIRNYKHYLLYNFLSGSNEEFNPDSFYEVCDSYNHPSSHVKAQVDIKRIFLTIPELIIEKDVVTVNYKVCCNIALIGSCHVKGSLIALSSRLTAYIGPKTKIEKGIVGFEKVILLNKDDDID